MSSLIIESLFFLIPNTSNKVLPLLKSSACDPKENIYWLIQMWFANSNIRFVLTGFYNNDFVCKKLIHKIKIYIY